MMAVNNNLIHLAIMLDGCDCYNVIFGGYLLLDDIIVNVSLAAYFHLFAPFNFVVL